MEYLNPSTFFKRPTKAEIFAKTLIQADHINDFRPLDKLLRLLPAAKDSFQTYEKGLENRNFAPLVQNAGSPQEANRLLDRLDRHIRRPAMKTLGPKDGVAIPNRAHFIWFTCKDGTAGEKGKALPEKYKHNLNRFRSLNPQTPVTLWTDNPHSVHQAFVNGEQGSIPKVTIRDINELFQKRWHGVSRMEKKILHSAILRESTGAYNNPHSAKDIAQIVVLKHEPGWFFDLDTRFSKPLPKTYAPAKSGSLFNFKENSVMCFNEEGIPDLNRILKHIAGDYNVFNDIGYNLETSSATLIYDPMKRKGPAVHSESKKADIFWPSLQAIKPSPFRNKVYGMFDLKRVDGLRNRGRLTTNVTAFPFHQLQNVDGHAFFPPLNNKGVFNLPDSFTSWAVPPERLRRSSVSF